MPIDPYQAFLVHRRADLRRIALRTCGEHTVEDVESEAWLIAQRIATKRGFPIDFSHRADQDQLLAWLHNHLVKYADKQLRYAVKLDKDWDTEDGDYAVHAMARLLTAADVFDPAVLLQMREDSPDPLSMTKHSYSQASGYVILLCRFDWDSDELADHLHIVKHTLLARLRWFGAWTRWQPSLFDGVQTIAIDFEPTRNRSRASRLFEPDGGTDPQLAWRFAVAAGSNPD